MSYGHKWVGTYQNGRSRSCNKVLAVVSYDLKHHQYIIDYDDMDNFAQWVIPNWAEGSTSLYEALEESEEAFFDQVCLRFYEIGQTEQIDWEYAA